MSWFKKIASITFFPIDSHKISQPKTVFNLSYALMGWVYKNLPEELRSKTPEPVASDGLTDMDKMTGIINWYVPKEVEMQDVVPYIFKAIEQEFTPLGISVSHIEKDKSNMFDENVLRLHVNKNETSEQQAIPELNAANRNALILLKILGLEEDYSGTVDAQEIKNRIEKLRQTDLLKDFTLDPSETQSVKEQDPADWWKQEEPQKGPRMIDMGLSQEQLNRYLDELEQIADYALTLNNKKVCWA